MLYMALCSTPLIGLFLSIGFALVLYAYFLAISLAGFAYLLFLRPLLVLVGILDRGTWGKACGSFGIHICKIWGMMFCGLFAGLLVATLALPLFAIMGLPVLLIEANMQALGERLRKGEIKLSVG